MFSLSTNVYGRSNVSCGKCFLIDELHIDVANVYGQSNVSCGKYFLIDELLIDVATIVRNVRILLYGEPMKYLCRILFDGRLHM